MNLAIEAARVWKFVASLPTADSKVTTTLKVCKLVRG